MSDPTISIYNVSYTPALVDNATLPNPLRYPWTSAEQSLAELYKQPLPGLGNETLENILSDPKYHSVKIVNNNIKLTGSHQYDFSDGSRYTLNIYDSTGNKLSFGDSLYDSGAGVGGVNNINANHDVLPFASSVVPFGDILSSYVLGLDKVNYNGQNYPYRNMTLTFTVSVQVGLCVKDSADIAFLNSAISNDVCQKYCNSTNGGLGQKPCFNNYFEYCLTPTQSDNYKTLRISTSTPCLNYFSNYITNVQTNKVIDEPLEKYCKAKYKGLKDLESANNVDKQLCNCNMPETIYNTYISGLLGAFPQFKPTSGLNERCYYGPCASIGLKNNFTTQVCNVPQCLSITGINNSGTFEGVKIINNQDTRCAAIYGGTGANGTTNGTTNRNNTTNGNGSDPDKEQTFWEKYKWIILGGGGALLLLIIIIIVVVVI